MVYPFQKQDFIYTGKHSNTVANRPA